VCDHVNLLERDYFGLSTWATPTSKVGCRVFSGSFSRSARAKWDITHQWKLWPDVYFISPQMSADMVGIDQRDQEAGSGCCVRVHVQREVLPSWSSTSYRRPHQVNVSRVQGVVPLLGKSAYSLRYNMLLHEQVLTPWTEPGCFHLRLYAKHLFALASYIFHLLLFLKHEFTKMSRQYNLLSPH